VGAANPAGVSCFTHLTMYACLEAMKCDEAIEKIKPGIRFVICEKKKRGEEKMKNIRYEEFSEGNIEFLRDLVNDLMRFQAEHATIRQEVMASMNFDNRLNVEYGTLDRKNMVVAYDDEKPVGFAFAAVSRINEETKSTKPSWAAELGGLGFYPDDYKVPKNIGTFKLLFVNPEYRGENIGLELSTRTMHWLNSQKEVEDLWVFVANGNEAVGHFYEKFGFQFSHKVFNGFIEAYCQLAQ